MQGLRRTKLGLRQFITLGEFTQSIDLERSLATNQARLVTFLPTMCFNAVSSSCVYKR